MKSKIPYQHFKSFILRSPLFPFDFIESVVSGRDISGEKILEIFQKPVVQEALFLASPDLYSQLQQRLEGNLTDKKKVRRLHYALMRYLLRMCSRPTPFGLFAGYNVGTWADETRVELPPQEEYTRHTRLDMNYLCALAQDLANHEVIKGKIKYYPNSSIYPVGDQLRYVEYRYRNTRRTHHIVAVDHSEYLQRILDTASHGAPLDQLVELLVDDEITAEESREFIQELIDSQLLVNELEPAITGPEFLDQIMAVLERIDGIDNIRGIIAHTKKVLEEIDNSKIGSTVSYYHRIAEDLKPLGTTFEMKFLFQTDMVKPVNRCTMDEKFADDILEGMEVLNKLTGRPESTNLTQFRDAFFERYETREVPLLQALDTEAGVGYRQTRDAGDIAPLVDDLAIPGGSGEASQDIKWNRVQAILFKKYKEALRDNRYEVELTDKDVEPFESNWNDLPDTFSAMVQVVEGPTEENPHPKFSFSGFGGSSSGNLLGRFCHGDPGTDTFVKEITKKEEELNPGVILAEIIHLPESRVGNVLLRPVLRPYEIPYLAKAAVDPEYHIKVEDLMVSVAANRIVLRSKRLNKEIIPHLTNAHNFSYNALPVYHFLADLQTQGLRGGIGFNWGALSNEYEFQPRVTYKNLVFSPATWNVNRDDIKRLSKIKDADELQREISAWREKLRIPPYVLLVDSDNRLFINLDNIMCIRTLLSVTKNRGSFQLAEFLFDPGKAVVKGPGGVFTNEFVFSFYNSGKEQANLERAQQTNNNDKQ